jgi:hypothetical protein
VRDKLAKLVNVRRHKMEEGLHQIGSTATVRVNGLGAYELNLIRANFQGALNMFLKLETVRRVFVGRGVPWCVGAAAMRRAHWPHVHVHAPADTHACPPRATTTRHVRQAEAHVAGPVPLSGTYGSSALS